VSEALGKLATGRESARLCRRAGVNARRIAALLRELADAFEAVEPARKRKARKVEAPATGTSAADQQEARRALRKAGFAA
jgi:Holliday junction resolvasome RuvABC DNA-binding subunit